MKKLLLALVAGAAFSGGNAAKRVGGLQGRRRSVRDAAR